MSANTVSQTRNVHVRVAQPQLAVFLWLDVAQLMLDAKRIQEFSSLSH